MKNLPKFRVNQYLTFHNIIPNYAGPVLIKDRSTTCAKLTKAYIWFFFMFESEGYPLRTCSRPLNKVFHDSLKKIHC